MSADCCNDFFLTFLILYNDSSFDNPRTCIMEYLNFDSIWRFHALQGDSNKTQVTAFEFQLSLDHKLSLKIAQK